MTLYKYLTADRSDILELGLIRYTQPVYLNDPFEMTPRFGEMFSDKEILKAFSGKARKQAIDEMVQKLPPQFHRRARFLAWLLYIVKRRQMRESLRTIAGTLALQFRQQFPQIIDNTLRRSIGVLSLTGRHDNLLMWSHYADQHRGFVLVLDERHAVFNQRRSAEDEFNYPRQVVYSKEKVVGQLTDMSGIDLLLRKSPEWAHEEEWRIVKPLDQADAMGITPDRSVFLYGLPPDAIKGVIYGAHIAEESRLRIQAALYKDPARDHIWQKQAEIASDKFALNFFPLPGKPTISPLPDAQLHFHDVEARTLPDIFTVLSTVIGDGVRQPLDLSRLKDIHICADPRRTIATLLGQETLFGAGDAQVLAGSGNEEADVYVFLRAGCLKPWAEATAQEQAEMLHLLHRQMARVHNITVRYRAFGEKQLTTTQPGANGYLAPVALNIWNDYVVARLSASSMPPGKVLTFIPGTAEKKQTCAAAIAADVLAYRTHGDHGRIAIEVVNHLQTYLCSIAEALGYADGGNPIFQRTIVDGVKIAAGPQQATMMDDLIATFRRMYRYYPVWEEFSMYDELIFAVRILGFQHGISMRDVPGGKIHIAVP